MDPTSPLPTSFHDDEARAQGLLTAAQSLIASSSEPGIRQALPMATEAVDILQRLHAAGVPGVERSLAHAWLTKANALRESGDTAARPEALLAYEETLRLFQAVQQPGDLADANHLAKIWMSRGMTLLDDGRPAVLPEALECFEKALELRKGLPLEQDWRFAWALSAAWMNRGDVLTRLGGPERVAEALHSYDEALVLLEKMPHEEYPTCRARQALAWMNRGLTCQTQGPDFVEEALRCFDECITLLQAGGPPENPEQRRILACARLNRGHAYLNRRPPEALPAREEALAGLALAEEFEKQEALAALVSLQSRHLLCRATGHLVDQGEASQDWVTETTDAVDDGMALARYWRMLGEERLTDMEVELFRFGALIYRLCQPHFLAEFLLETMDPERSPGAPVQEARMHHLASEALWSVATDLRARQRGASEEENESRFLPQLQELLEAEQRFQELREKHLAG